MSKIKHYSPIKGIDVYDNVFDLAKRFDIQESVKKCPYQMGWADNTEKAEQYMFSNWLPEKLNSINFFSDFKGSHPLHEKINPDKFIRCIVNNDVCSNTHWTHTHINENVFLYYVNMEWQEHWGGETLFFDKNDSSNIIFGSRYIPGRIIWFDGEIPHTIKSQSRLGPKYRFSISIFFKK
jgi:hypothetical protein